MKRILHWVICIATAMFVSAPAMAEIIYGVSGSTLLRVDSTAPATTISSVTVTGLQPGELILGIDFRLADGQLYALGSTSRLYTINGATGVATEVGSGPFSTMLSGTSFGFALNPVVLVDRFRVVSNTGQNIRLNPNNATIAAVDTNLNGGATTAVAAAYTNSVVGATVTTLYVIDAASDTLYTQGSIDGTPISPNTGQLFAVGPLGINGTDFMSFDISSTGVAYASIEVGGTISLYTINLATGAATLVGGFPPQTRVTAIAVQPGVITTVYRDVPTLPVYGLVILAALLGFVALRGLRFRG